MNARIKELEQQARFAVQDENDKAPYDKWRDKFAELIVRECADIASKNQAEDMNWNIAEIIKEHFGIK